ncbi:MAG: sugar-binding domain-containing protein [Acidobacteriota bacterium]
MNHRRSPARVPVMIGLGLALSLPAIDGRAPTQSSPGAAWAPATSRLMTRFGRSVSPSNAWPEYPRPQLVRPDWQNLNGLWEYAVRPRAAAEPGGGFDGHILVPYPIESALSGVGQRITQDQRLWYRRTFDVPPAWKGRRIWLRFGAVDWEASVWVNGQHVGTHTGGYDPFAWDITSALKPAGKQTLVLGVWDPSDQGDQPRGKQVANPRGIWYTPSTGIWQTVWLEPLPDVAISRLRMVPDADTGTLAVEAVLTRPSSGYTLHVAASAEREVVATAEGPAAGPVTVTVPRPRLWSPAHPFLYNLVISLLKGDTRVDEVRSYAGLRKISLGTLDNGAARLLLNNEPLFQYGFLDQGFWPDGLHTPPSDDAIRFEIAATRGLGMNLARKHIKVEPDRWYYWADRLGLLVWQDMPSGRNSTPEARANFADEWRRIIEARYNHPSIVLWVPFNEGWGQPDAAGTREIADMTAKLDPTRLVINASGWRDSGAGHVSDIHRYPGPAMPALEKGRAAVLGEFGGLGLPTPGHTWQDEKNWGYVSYTDAPAFEQAYREKIGQLRLLVARGLSAAIYTQTTDVEIEVNGLMTYDREIVKIAPAKLQEIHATLYDALPSVVQLLPLSDLQPRTWRFTTDVPPDTWMSPDFDDGAWQTGLAPFGAGSTEGVPRRTSWTTPSIWLRQSFVSESGSADGLHLVIAHDEDATIYLNGVEAASMSGYTTGYVIVPVRSEAARAIRKGVNVVAVTCRQTKGGQVIDAGLVEIRPSTR